MTRHDASATSPRRFEDLLEAFAEGRRPMEIARAFGLSLCELAEFMAAPEHARALHSVVRLFAIHQAIVLASGQCTALATLAALAADDSPPESNLEARARETRRRASAEVLRAKAAALEAEAPVGLCGPAPETQVTNPTSTTRAGNVGKANEVLSGRNGESPIAPAAARLETHGQSDGDRRNLSVGTAGSALSTPARELRPEQWPWEAKARMIPDRLASTRPGKSPPTR